MILLREANGFSAVTASVAACVPTFRSTVVPSYAVLTIRKQVPNVYIYIYIYIYISALSAQANIN
jgi:hypothetical protein